MAIPVSRETLLLRLREKVHSKTPIFGYGAGSGLSALAAEQAGVDYISLYTTAMYRMDGLPTILAWMPYGNVNEDMAALAGKVLPLVKHTPCMAGLGPHDPRLDLRRLVDRFADMGFSGINNEPFSSMYGGLFYDLLNRAGLGIEREVRLMEAARERGLFTAAWTAAPGEAAAFAQAGVDLVGALLPIDEDGEDPNEYWDRCVSSAAETIRAARRSRPDILTVIHGGPLNTSVRIQEALSRTGADGYASGSNMEKAPAVRAIQAAIDELKGLAL